MQFFSSFVFHTMLFSHNGKIVTINQLTHYEPNQSGNLNKILKIIRASTDLFPIINVEPSIFQDPSLVGSYQGGPPSLPTTWIDQFYTITSNNVEILHDPSLEGATPPSFMEIPIPQVTLERSTSKTSLEYSPIQKNPPIIGNLPKWMKEAMNPQWPPPS